MNEQKKKTQKKVKAEKKSPISIEDARAGIRFDLKDSQRFAKIARKENRITPEELKAFSKLVPKAKQQSMTDDERKEHQKLLAKIIGAKATTLPYPN